MGVGPGGGPVASGESAVAVSDGEGSTLGGGDGLLGPSYVEGLGWGCGDDAGDLGVAGDPTCRLGGDGPGSCQFGLVALAVLEGLKVDEDVDVGSFPTDRLVTGVEVATANIDQSFRPASARRGGIPPADGVSGLHR